MSNVGAPTRRSLMVGVAMVSLVAAAGGMLAATQVWGRSSAGASPAGSVAPSPTVTPSPAVAPSPSAAAPMVIRFEAAHRTLPDSKATVEYPRITVTGGQPGTADRVANTVNDRLNAMIDVFARGAIDVEGVPVEQLFDSIAGDSRTTSPTWGRYLSVVLDESTNLGGAHPNNRSIGLVFDTGSGDRVQPSDIFADLDAASSAVRAALVRSRAGTPGPVTAQDVAAVSLRPGDDGTTTPLTWYPTDEGLAVVVDQDSVVAYVLGPIEATVPWAQLAGLLRPGVSP